MSVWNPGSIMQPDTPALPSAPPLAGGVLAGLVASACCGGTLLFASIGLGVFYGALGLARYIPQELGLGAAAIVAINWLYYRHRAGASAAACDRRALRRAMVSSAGAGLLSMGAGFILLEWLNHGVVNAAHHHPAAGSLLPWTSNQNLVYMVAAIALGGLVVSLLPLPARDSKPAGFPTMVQPS